MIPPRLSLEARAASERILNTIPQDRLQMTHLTGAGGKPLPGTVPYYRSPLSGRLEFTTTAAEREVMKAAARQYNAEHQDDPLLAHGTSSATRLCHIICDGRLVHNVEVEHYGSLDSTQSVQADGYYDYGWGVFVARASVVRGAVESARQGHYWVPVSDLEGIVLPTQVAPLVRSEFPRYANLIFGYQGFAAKIERQGRRIGTLGVE